MPGVEGWSASFVALGIACGVELSAVPLIAVAKTWLTGPLDEPGTIRVAPHGLPCTNILVLPSSPSICLTTLAIASTPSPPGRSTLTSPSPPSLQLRPSTTVLSTPTPQSPPSNIHPRPSAPPISCTTCSALVGLGRPDEFADGALTGVLASCITASASGWEGIRIPLVCGAGRGGGCGEGKRRVSGPGQKAVMSAMYSLDGIYSDGGGKSRRSMSRDETCMIRGLSDGRFLIR